LGQVLHQGNWTGCVADFVTGHFAATGDVKKRSINTMLERIFTMAGDFNHNFVVTQPGKPGGLSELGKRLIKKGGLFAPARPGSRNPPHARLLEGHFIQLGSPIKFTMPKKTTS
jgi:hypothetical protein